MNTLDTMLTPTDSNTPVIPTMEVATIAAVNQDSGEVTFFDYDSSAQYPAPDNQRLVTCTYRNKAGATDVRKNQACFVPNWITQGMIEENTAQLLPYFVAFLQDKEEAMVKDSHKTHSILLGASKFGIEAMLEYLEASLPAGRLNSADINTWFCNELMESLTSIYTEKVGSAKVNAVVAFINKKFQSLASPKTIWNDAEIDKLMPILEACEDDTMATRLVARIKGMKMLDAADILDSL